MLAKDRIIVAVDVDNPTKAIALLILLKAYVGSFKIGLELITALLISMLVLDKKEALKNLGLVREFFKLIGDQFFWDGKFDDIPNTVGAVAKIVGHAVKVRMFNVHASCSVKGMMAAVANKGQSQVLAVTVLTSTDENNAFAIFGAPSKAKVLQFAREAKLAGCDGIVCSPQELLVLDDQPELASLRRVTPGIRSQEDPADDQNRTMTAHDAIVAGASELVIGRPITGATSPVEAAQKIASQIEIALPKRFHLCLFNLSKIKFGSFKLKLHQTNPTAPESPIYLDIRGLPAWLYLLAGDILHDLAVREGITDFDYVIGIPKAGEPIGIAFANAVGKPHLSIVKEEGDGGRKITSQILSPFLPGKKVVLIDDLITKAGTKREAIEAIEANGLIVVATLVLYDREQGGLAELNAEGRKVCAASTLTKALDFYVERKKITPEKRTEVLAYVAAN